MSPRISTPTSFSPSSRRRSRSSAGRTTAVPRARPTACWPTTPAPSPSFWPTASIRPTRVAVTCCGASSAARYATPELLGRLALLERDGATQDALDDEEQEVSAVQHRHRQQVEDGEVHADDRREERERGKPLPTLTFAFRRDLNRAAQVRERQLERHELPEPLGREHRHLPGPHSAVADGEDRVVGLVVNHLGDDADADASDLDVLAGGVLLLHGRRRHLHGDRLAVTLDHNVERLAAALLDRLHELLGRKHRLSRDRGDGVASP